MKKRLLAFLLALSLLSTAAVAASKRTLSISAVVEGEELCAVEADGKTYLFLPSGADTGALTLRASIDGAAVELRVDGESADADGVFDLTRAARGENGAYTVTLEADGLKQQLTVMVGTGLPTIYLQSDSAEQGREWVDSDKANKATGTMRLKDADGDSVYDGALTQIKARGNSTFRSYPKKAYQIKLEKKADLLGTGEKVKTWVLLANYGDATMQHDKLMKDLAAALGMDYTASCDWVNLYYDGEYRGVYLLSEKNSVGSTGVDITDMEEAYESLNADYGKNVTTAEGEGSLGQTYVYTTGLTEPEDVTGGWLIECNLNKLDEINGFITTRGAAFNIKSPEWVGEKAIQYISDYYQSFERAVYALNEDGFNDGVDPETGKSYDEYVDRDSLIKVFLLQELALNPDGFGSSFFFYKDAGELMYAGPIWDQDMTLGTGWSKFIPHTVSDYHYLQTRLIKIYSFREAMEDYFSTTFLPTVERWLGEGGTIAEQTARLAPSAAMNYVLWPYVRVGDPENAEHLWAEGTDYAAVTDDMRDWVAQRLEVLRKMYFDGSAVTYSDVPRGHWAYRAVRSATEQGLLRGVGDGAFAPDATVDQGTAFTVLARLDSQDTVATGGAAWYQAGMDWARSRGLTASDDASAVITREQLVRALWRLADEPDTSTDCLRDFPDGEAVSADCAEAMAWAVESGILHGDELGRLLPTEPLTRAQLAQVLKNRG